MRRAVGDTSIAIVRQPKRLRKCESQQVPAPNSAVTSPGLRRSQCVSTPMSNIRRAKFRLSL